ncbi:MAG: hypothetical protein Q7S18_00120 [bacterium]|nr:hypothetical protein [bacterium]
MGEIRVKFGKIFGKNNLYFLAIMLAASLAVFLFFQKDYKIYETETNIVVISDERTFETLIALPQKLSFYDSVLKNDQTIQDYFALYPESKRKDLWNNTIDVEQEGNSSIIKIRIKDASQDRSLKLSKAASKALLDFSDEIYGQQNNVKLLII